MLNKEIKTKRIKLRRKVCKEVINFQKSHPEFSKDVNKFFIYANRQKISELLAEFVITELEDNSYLYKVPFGEIGLLFRKYVLSFM